MLDESSAGAEVGVIWDATRARLEQCNTCFEKSGRLPVHLGLDPAKVRDLERAAVRELRRAVMALHCLCQLSEAFRAVGGGGGAHPRRSTNAYISR